MAKIIKIIEVGPKRNKILRFIAEYLTEFVTKHPVLLAMVIIFVIGLIILYYPAKEQEQHPLVDEEELMLQESIERQLKELDALREQSVSQEEPDHQQQTEGDTETQLQELDKLREVRTKDQPLTQEEIDKQLEELDKLRKLRSQ